MGDFLKSANSSLFYVCGVLITLFVLLQAYLFWKLAFKEGLKCGLTKAQMFKALRTGFVSSIIPSIAGVAALLAMVPALGLPIPWIRQTIMGSTAYELTAAGIGTKAMGVSTLGGEGYTAPVFASAVWVMTIGSIWAVVILVFFLKMIKKRFSKTSNVDSEWKKTLMNAAFFGVFSIFIAGPVTSGGIPLTTLVAGGVLMSIFALLIVKLKANWLREFALTFSMLGAMICAAIVTNLFA